jgi:uncharacterized membrane protein
MEAPWHLAFMALLYILAGILHFVFPEMYQRIIPPYIPGKRTVVYLSGILEIILGGALFFPGFRTLALYGIIGLLLLFLPAHIHMLRDKRAGLGLPAWALWLRLPLQGLLIFWASLYL